MTKTRMLCIDNKGHEASLEKLKLYITARDESAEAHGLIRVIDESGDSYLYPKSMFLGVPKTMATKVEAALAASLKGRRPRRTKKHETPKRSKTAA